MRDLEVQGILDYPGGPQVITRLLVIRWRQEGWIGCEDGNRGGREAVQKPRNEVSFQEPEKAGNRFSARSSRRKEDL